MGELLVLGLDGLDRYFIEENIEELEAFGELFEQGSTSLLESTLPPITIPAWACSFTGKKPEKLGRFDFQVVDFEDYSFSPVKNSDFFYQEFWEFMDGKAAVSDVPGADVREMDGWIVGGLFDVSGTTYPEDLADEMKQEIGDVEIHGLKHLDSEKERREKAFEFFEKRKKILYWMLDEKDASVYFPVFRLPDTMMHHCSNDRQMLEAYRRCDEMLGDLMERDIDIIVVSDHGAFKANKRFSVNTWLRDHGYLKQEEGSERAWWRQKVFQLAEKLENLGLRDHLVWMNEKYKNLRGEGFVERNLELGTVDWERTEAFSYMTGVCRYSGIWINDGRFSEASVSDTEKKQQEIREKLARHELVEDVLTKQEAFDTDVDTFPDLVAVLEEKVKNDSDIKPSVTGEISSYMHRKEGFIGVYGDTFDMEEEDAALIDLAPTVLHYFGSAIPEDVDGKVVDVFSSGSEPGKREPETVSDDLGSIDF